MYLLGCVLLVLCVLLFVFRMRSVSYTHLDVYKRQGVKYLSDSTVLGSRERSPVLSFRCGHSHRTKGELIIFFVNHTGGCGDVSWLIPLASMNVSMRFFMLRHKISH